MTKRAWSHYNFTNRWLQSVSDQGGPSNRMNLRRLIMAPEVLSNIIIKTIVSHSQTVTDHINYGGHTHGVHILSISHFHFHALLKSVVRLALQLLKKFYWEGLRSWEAFEQVISPIGTVLSDSCRDRKLMILLVLVYYQFTDPYSKFEGVQYQILLPKSRFINLFTPIYWHLFQLKFTEMWLVLNLSSFGVQFPFILINVFIILAWCGQPLSSNSVEAVCRPRSPTLRNHT